MGREPASQSGEFAMNPEFMMFVVVPSIIVVGILLSKMFKD
jgi:hypothetical protein